jgi:hypothetical protein
MRPTSRFLLALTAAVSSGLLTTTVLTTPAAAAPRAGAPPQSVAAVMTPGAADPTVRSTISESTDSTAVSSSQVDERLDADDTASFGWRRRHYVRRNQMLDAWNGWYGPANYRFVRYTWTGTWRIKNIWDSHGGARATAAAFCGFLSRWYPLGTICSILVLAHYWMIESTLNRAIRQRRCFTTLSKRWGLLATTPQFLTATMRCDR